jgi:divalent metal cation (Fe/Co/Zn/Cd) transporter
VHAEAQRGRDSSADLYAAAKLAARELDLHIHECWVQEVDGVLSVHLHVGVNPNLTISEAHDLVDQLEQIMLERQSTIDSVHSHIELANKEILPGARVSTGLQERVSQVIDLAIEKIPGLSNPHDMHVRQIEGRLFISVEAWVDGELSVSDAHELSTQLQEMVRKGIGNAGEVLVHLEPLQSEAEPNSPLHPVS